MFVLGILIGIVIGWAWFGLALYVGTRTWYR